MAYLNGSSEDIEVMLTKGSDKEVHKSHTKLKPMPDIVI